MYCVPGYLSDVSEVSYVSNVSNVSTSLWHLGTPWHRFSKVSLRNRFREHYEMRVPLSAKVPQGRTHILLLLKVFAGVESV